MGLPLKYVQRNHYVVTNYMLKELYDDTDIKFIRIFKLEGDAYTSDIKRVFDELKLLIVDRSGWTYMKPFGPKNMAEVLY